MANCFKVFPKPVSTEAVIFSMGMPNMNPATIDTTKNARNGLTLAQVTSTTSKMRQNKIESRAIDNSNWQCD